MRPIIDLEDFVRFADHFQYGVGNWRIAFFVPVRRPRDRWWQFWRPNARVYLIREVFHAPLDGRLLHRWIARLDNPRVSHIDVPSRGAPRILFRSSDARAMLRREIAACLCGMGSEVLQADF